MVNNLLKYPIENIKRVIVVDTQRRDRVKHLGEEILKKLDENQLECFIYDHHPPNPQRDLKEGKKLVKFWGSCCSVIVDEIKNYNQENPTSKIHLSKEEASILAIGIYEDTGAFLYEYTKTQDLL